MGIASVDAELEAAADPDHAWRAQRGMPCLRGYRGVPSGALAGIVALAWRRGPPRLPEDAAALEARFARAWEDGMLAIGLLSTCVTEAPADALRVGLALAERTDDVATADALGWLVLAPAVLLEGALEPVLDALGGHRRDEVRRAAVAMGLGFLPLELEGPAAAALREKLGERHVRLVDAPLGAPLARVCSRFAKDAAPPIQKGLRRVLRAWGDADPDAVVRWAPTVKGGIPKFLRAEVDRARAGSSG